MKWLRANTIGKAEAVDKEANVLRGYVVAQEGPFKSQGRGEFDMKSLRTIVEMGNASGKGLKSRLGHPTLSDDGVGKFLGRSREFRLGRTFSTTLGRDVAAVRADLHFDKTAHDTPHGDLAGYVMSLAESDADAISSSLVLSTAEEVRLDDKRKPLTDDNGEPLPPLWRPTALHASDIVDTGDAVDGLLSASDLCKALSIGETADLSKVLRFDNVVRLGSQLLDGVFPNAERADIETRCLAWVQRYLDQRFGEEVIVETPRLDKALSRMCSKGHTSCFLAG